jgi:hypothetical protein
MTERAVTTSEHENDQEEWGRDRELTKKTRSWSETTVEGQKVANFAGTPRPEKFQEVRDGAEY